MSKIRAPFPWFGGKGNPKIKNAVLAALPPHTRYIEPFGGGASILMAKNRLRLKHITMSIVEWSVSFVSLPAKIISGLL